MKSGFKESVSIALCTYNGGRYLGEQLDSLNSQTLIPDELVACDDNSSDNTVEILKGFSKIARFPVRIYANSVNLGVAGNFGKCISLCKGGLIALCDQDDVWKPQKLEKLTQKMEKHPEAYFAFCDAELVDEELRSLGRRLWDEKPNRFLPIERHAFEGGGQFPVLLKKNMVTGACMLFRASIVPHVLPIPPCWIHDYWIASVATALGSGGIIVEEPLILYRQHSAQKVGTMKGNIFSRLSSGRKRWHRLLDRDIKRAGTLTKHLVNITPRQDILDSLRTKSAFLETRFRMLSMDPLSRLVPAMKMLGKGFYDRYSPYGWRACLMDIIAPKKEGQG